MLYNNKLHFTSENQILFFLIIGVFYFLKIQNCFHHLIIFKSLKEIKKLANIEEK